MDEKRQPRFRAYNKKTKQLEHVLLMCFVNRYVDVLPEANLEGGSQESWGFEDIEVMQYTGLKDKNGKEIYEGDIIRAYQSDGSEVIHSISYSDSEARFIVSCVGYRSLSGGFDQKWIDEFGKEIIGNIYENPELSES